MSNLPATAVVIIHRQLGHITALQLHETGVSDRQRKALQRTGVLEQVGRSVYRVPGMPRSLESRAIEVSLEHTCGFITGPTAGVLLGLRKMPPTFQIDLCVPHGSKSAVPSHVRLRQSRLIEPSHVCQLENGIRIASFARLAFDLATDLDSQSLSSVVEQMVQRRAVTSDALFEIAALMWSPRRPGSSNFTKMLLRRHGGAAAESHPELRVLEGLLARNVPVRPQQQLMLSDGRPIRIDMAVPEVRWAVEVDVHPSHHGIEGTTNDKRRDRQLHRSGWQVERVTSIDLMDEAATCDELADLYRSRVAALSRT